ncbi:MAG: xylose isomerase [Gammaproteobacteria bacterium]|nr:xylose isomerase [Gammaproteobacteria bacterium]
MRSRRRFLIGSGWGVAALASGALRRAVGADALGKHPGIQLYTINDAMRADPRGALQRLREIGFVEVETAGFGGLSAQQFRGLLNDAGVSCPSSHLQFDLASLERAFDDAHALGAKFAVSSIMRSLVLGPDAPKDVLKTGMSLDEAKRTAELANRIGAAAQRAGLQFTYHNHNFEFADQGGGLIGYDMLLKETDPKLVKFEIDCGWMIFAGHDPVGYLQKYPQRFPMIHVKDFLPRENGSTEMRGAELGHGTVDYKPIFAAATKAGLQHYFVEQEGPFARMSPVEAAQVDFEYLRAIGRA